MRGLLVCSMFGICSVATAWGEQGIVQTLDGKSFEGEVRLESSGITVSTTNEPSPSRIEWANLSLLRFQPVPPADLPPPTGRVEAPPAAASPGILLTSGSLITRRISSGDESAVHFLDSTNEVALSLVKVARIVFQPLSPELQKRIQPRKAGLLLSNREFVEGEFRGFAQGQIKISSVLFGINHYDPGQVIAVILREPQVVATRFELRIRDESLFLADSVQVKNEFLNLPDVGAGMRIPVDQVIEIKHRVD